MSCDDESQKAPLEIAIGEDRTFLFVVKDPKTKLSLDITSARVYFTVKLRIEDATWTIRKRSANAGGSIDEVEVLDQSAPATLGAYHVKLVPADTLKLDFKKSPLVCDSWVVLQSNKRYQVLRRRSLILDASVTQF